MTGLLLEIVEGGAAGTQIALDHAVEIGRDSGDGLTLLDPQVSRHHARVEAGGAGATVADLGSTNGTYVNDQLIEGPRPLSPGDRVRVGTTVLELRSEAQIAAQPSAVVPMPKITAAGEVLAPVAERELSGVFEAPAIPGLRRDETPAGYIPAGIMEAEVPTPAAPAARAPVQGYGAPRLEGMVDSRVKHQTSVAAFAFLAIAALAVLIYFGAT